MLISQQLCTASYCQAGHASLHSSGQCRTCQQGSFCQSFGSRYCASLFSISQHPRLSPAPLIRVYTPGSRSGHYHYNTINRPPIHPPFSGKAHSAETKESPKQASICLAQDRLWEGDTLIMRLSENQLKCHLERSERSRRGVVTDSILPLPRFYSRFASSA